MKVAKSLGGRYHGFQPGGGVHCTVGVNHVVACTRLDTSIAISSDSGIKSCTRRDLAFTCLNQDMMKLTQTEIFQRPDTVNRSLRCSRIFVQ